MELRYLQAIMKLSYGKKFSDLESGSKSRKGDISKVFKELMWFVMVLSLWAFGVACAVAYMFFGWGWEYMALALPVLFLCSILYSAHDEYIPMHRLVEFLVAVSRELKSSDVVAEKGSIGLKPMVDILFDTTDKVNNRINKTRKENKK
jgi:hypothetical protein